MTSSNRWRKSSYSGNEANCVQIAWSRQGVSVRDSKNPSRGSFAVNQVAFRRFVASMKG